MALHAPSVRSLQQSNVGVLYVANDFNGSFNVSSMVVEYVAFTMVVGIEKHKRV